MPDCILVWVDKSQLTFETTDLIVISSINIIITQNNTKI